MTAEPLPDVPEEQLASRLQQLTRTAQAGAQAEKDRALLIMLAIERYGWTQQRIAAVCPMKQPAVSRLWRARCKRREPTTTN